LAWAKRSVVSNDRKFNAIHGECKSWVNSKLVFAEKDLGRALVLQRTYFDFGRILPFSRNSFKIVAIR
jgi:hypothetical protein